MTAVGAYLQARRKAEKLTQECVAQKIGVTSRTVSSWERGKEGPSFETMARLLALIKGRAEIVQYLVLKADATKEEGRTLAVESLADAWYAQMMRTTTDRDALRQRLVKAIDGLLDHPKELDRALDQP